MGGYRCTGVSVRVGISVYRCGGISVYRCIGVWGSRCIGVWGYRCIGVGGYRCIGVSVRVGISVYRYRCMGACRDIGVSVWGGYRCIGVSVQRGFGTRRAGTMQQYTLLVTFHILDTETLVSKTKSVKRLCIGMGISCPVMVHLLSSRMAAICSAASQMD